MEHPMFFLFHCPCNANCWTAFPNVVAFDFYSSDSILSCGRFKNIHDLDGSFHHFNSVNLTFKTPTHTPFYARVFSFT